MSHQTRKMRVDPGVRYILPRGGVSDEPAVLLRDTDEDLERLRDAEIRAFEYREHGQLCQVSLGTQGPGGPCDCFIRNMAAARADAVIAALRAGKE